MPKLVNQNPSYQKHRASGQARVTIDGRDIYLGPYGTKASRSEYDRIVGEWLANGRRGVPEKGDDLSVIELVAAYWKHAQSYHKPAVEGGSNGELRGIKLALSFVKRLYADTSVSDFGPLSLKSVRQEMVSAGWSRGYTNAQVNRVRRLFKWGVENEMVPPSVLHGLMAVGGLRHGKTEARECAPVRPVAQETVEATLFHLSRHVQAMVRLQLLTGMRAGEVVVIRTSDIERSGDLWAYRPASHKKQHRGHDRVVYFGPKAQELLKPFLKFDPLAYLFAPAEVEAERREEAHAARRTPKSCGNVPGSNRKRRPKRCPGERYNVDGYRRAIAGACDKAFPPPENLAKQPGETIRRWRERLTTEQRKALAKWRSDHRWSPLRLRHSAATNLRRQHGLEAAQVLLGHKTLSVTQVYAEKNVEAARRVMAEAG